MLPFQDDGCCLYPVNFMEHQNMFYSRSTRTVVWRQRLTKVSRRRLSVVSPTFIRWVGTGTAVKNRQTDATRRRALESALGVELTTRTTN